MAIARGLERRLERLFEGSAGRVFSGRLHASELAGRVAREADLARFDHISGPGTANFYVIELNPRDVDRNHGAVEDQLSHALEEHAAERGLRLEGPARVEIRPTEGVPGGRIRCTTEVTPGPLPRWARLIGDTTHQLRHNRVMLGRAEDADVILSFPTISRHHALIWREAGEAWIEDLGSSNGTTLEQQPVGRGPTRLEHGAMVAFSSHAFRYLAT